MRIIIAALAALALTGCASFNATSAGARTAIEAATLKFIDGDQERANRVYEVTDGLLEVANADTERPVKKTLDAIEEKARERIEWSKLDEAEALVVHRLIDVARAEIKARVEKGTLDESQRLAVKTVLLWVRDIAKLSGGDLNGSNVEAMARHAGVEDWRAVDTQRPVHGARAGD